MNQTPPPPPPPGALLLPSHRPNPPATCSLTAALSELKSLLHLAVTTVRSIPSPTASAACSTFLPCPFNPNHRVPPSSLFSHYLNCPSPLSLPHTFHYPLTLRSSSTVIPTPPLTLPADSSDLTVSLDDYVAYISPANSIFYQNCPGPVTLTPNIQPPPSLNLHRVLYTEGADFDMESSLKCVMSFSTDFIQLLPSEIWVVRNETEAWGGGFPSFYSSRILRSIIRLKDCKLLHLYEWIITNSPRYGIIIDSCMRDHVVVLVRLCLKAIVREAFELAGVKYVDGELKKEEDVLLGLHNRSFECPVLMKVMMWLALQLSILYGEVNGKFLAIDVVKECILDSASGASFFHLEGEDAELNDVGKKGGIIVPMDETKRDEKDNIKGETVGNGVIFFSEVAAAVAALHERSFIEETIKALRYQQPVPLYHRNMEHAHLSKLADEERQRRPDYRAVIEHDGFLRHRSINQEANKVKTREELLAEERDYKRRRMSYRGKKAKRNPLAVTRDIIDEYMEEIRQAGGIGGTSKVVEETGTFTSEDIDRHASATYVSGSRRNSETPEENRGHSVDYRKGLHSRHYSRDFEDANQHPRMDSTWDHGRQYPNRNLESVRYDRADHSGSQDGRQINSHTREQGDIREKHNFSDEFVEDYSPRSRQRGIESHNRNYHKRSRDEHGRRIHRRGRDGHERTSHRRERNEDNLEYGDRGRSKTETEGASRERDEDMGARPDRRKSKTNRISSFHHELHELDDRYDPAESHP